MFKKMTDAEILNCIENKLKKDISWHKCCINEWKSYKKKTLIKDIQSNNFDSFNSALNHLNSCAEGIKYHKDQIELLTKYLNIIKDCRKNDPYYLTEKDIKEVCHTCYRCVNATDKSDHEVCQNLMERHKCRIYFDDDGNRIKEKLKCQD